MAVCLKFPPCHCTFVPISPLKWGWLLSCSFFFYFYFLWNLCLYAPSNLPSVEIPGLSTRRLRHIWREQWGDEDKIKEKKKRSGFCFSKKQSVPKQLRPATCAELPSSSLLWHLHENGMKNNSSGSRFPPVLPAPSLPERLGSSSTAPAGKPGQTQLPGPPLPTPQSQTRARKKKKRKKNSWSFSICSVIIFDLISCFLLILFAVLAAQK